MKLRHLLWLAALIATPVLAQNEAESSPPAKEDPEEALREPIPAKTDPTAAKLFATCVKATGGEQRMRSIQSMVADLKVSRGPYDVMMKVYVKRPNKSRTEVSQHHLGRDYKIYSGFDGETAWRQDFSEKKAFPQKLGGAEKEELEDLTFDDILIEWDKLGCKLEYLGPVNSRQRKNYLVKLYHPDGHTEYFYFDAKNYLLTRRGARDIVSGSIVDVDVYLTKYKKISGLWTPVELEVAFGGEPVIQMEYNDIQYNVPLKDDMFEMPKVKEVWLRSSN